MVGYRSANLNMQPRRLSSAFTAGSGPHLGDEGLVTLVPFVADRLVVEHAEPNPPPSHPSPPAASDRSRSP